MKLESLKNGKYSENILSKPSMAMLYGGRSVSSANGGDTYTYFCCGNLYDCTEEYKGSHTVTFRQEKMFEGTTAADYE